MSDIDMSILQEEKMAAAGRLTDKLTGKRMQTTGARSRVLRTANDLVNGDRNAQYGEPNADFQRTAMFWNEYLCGVAERKMQNASEQELENLLDTLCCLIDSHDIAWMMILMKASRSTVSPTKEDHYVDVAGYAACGADCVEGRKNI